MSLPYGRPRVIFSVSDLFPYTHDTFQTSLCAGLSAVTVLFALFITRSKPPTPVAASRDSEIEVPAFWQGVKICFRSKTYWVLAVCLGDFSDYSNFQHWKPTHMENMKRLIAYIHILIIKYKEIKTLWL